MVDSRWSTSASARNASLRWVQVVVPRSFWLERRGRTPATPIAGFSGGLPSAADAFSAAGHESCAGDTNGEHGHGAVGAAAIYPLMSSSVLDDTVSWMKSHFGAVSHDHRNTTAEHDDVIDRVR